MKIIKNDKQSVVGLTRPNLMPITGRHDWPEVASVPVGLIKV